MADLLLLESGFHLQQESGSFIILDAIIPIASVSCASGVIPNGNTAAAIAIDNLDLLDSPDSIDGQGLTGPTVIPTIPYINVTWTPTALGSVFDYYELQRIDIDGARTIAKITTETEPHFADFETKRGAATSYQVRVAHVGGALSAYTLSPGSCSVAAHDACEVVLASNANPLEALGLYDTTPKTFTRTGASDVEFIKIEGRGAPIGFVPSEPGGDVFTLTFLLAFNDPAIRGGAVTGGRAIFEPLRRLLEDPRLPSITVLDANGWRWYTTAKIGNMVWLEPVGSYKVDVQFTETAVASNPPVVVTAAPWGP